jgi:putative hemolysin
MNYDSNQNDLVLIDVEKAFASKDEKLLKRIPGFVIRYLKRIVRQKEINQFLTDNRDNRGVELARQALKFFKVKYTVENEDIIPKNSRLIVAANHPLGGLDGLCVTTILADNGYSEVKVIANDLLMNVKQMDSVFIGVNKHGGNPKAYVAEMHEAFEGDYPVLFFPAGLVSRRNRGKIQDTEWKPTFIKKAIQYKRDILPVYIHGRVSGFFYRLANLRKFLRIKQNIEMLYLPNEMFKHKNLRLKITFGKPIPWQTFDKKKSPSEWSLYVRKHVYDMGKSE